MGWVDRIAEMLKHTDWGVRFSPSEIKAIARHLSLKSFDKGQVVFNEGDPQAYLAFIVDGEVMILKSSDPACVIDRLHKGTHFGELALIDNHPRSATVVADASTILLILEQASFNELAQRYPHLGFKMIKNIAVQISARLRKTTEQLSHMEL